MSASGSDQKFKESVQQINFDLLMKGCGQPGLASETIKFLKSSRNIDLNKEGPYNMTLLMECCRSGALEVADELLQAGADPNIQDFYGRTAAMHWAGSDDADLTFSDILKDAGADFSIRDFKNLTAYDYAKKMGNTQLLDFLYKQSHSQKM